MPNRTPSDLKKLRLRYAGTCVACGIALPQGAQAMYHAAAKTVRCIECPDATATMAGNQSPLSEGDTERYMPPVRREQIRLAREARATATAERRYWTPGGVARGEAPPTIPAHEPDDAQRYRAAATEEGACEPTPIDSGSAGASAQREHDRRTANREARVKERFGRRFGGVLLAIVDEPQSTRAWAKGAHGERKLAESLARLPNVVALHDRSVPGTRGNIDHLVIAPAGLFVVDAKHYEGRLRIRDRGGLFRTDNRLYVGGRDCSKLAENMGWQVKAVETLLASVEVAMPVTPVLCFIDVDWPLLFAPSSFRGVRLEDPKSLRKLITATPALDAVAIDKLARILATGFPAK